MPSNFQHSFYRELGTELRGLEAQSRRSSQGNARLGFSLPCRIAEDEIVRLENGMLAGRDRACSAAAAGRALGAPFFIPGPVTRGGQNQALGTVVVALQAAVS